MYIKKGTLWNPNHLRCHEGCWKRLLELTWLHWQLKTLIVQKHFTHWSWKTFIMSCYFLNQIQNIDPKCITIASNEMAVRSGGGAYCDWTGRNESRLSCLWSCTWHDWCHKILQENTFFPICSRPQSCLFACLIGRLYRNEGICITPFGGLQS